MAKVDTVEMVTPEGDRRIANKKDAPRFMEEHGWKCVDDEDQRVAEQARAQDEAAEEEAPEEDPEFGEDHED